MNFKELEKNVIQWAEKKSLLAKDNSYQQYAKFQEESNEILIALNNNKKVLEKAQKLDVTNEAELKIFRDIRKDFENELKDAFGDTLVTLIILAKQNELKLEECLEYAYNEIKNRTGKTINGTFIKD